MRRICALSAAVVLVVALQGLSAGRAAACSLTSPDQLPTPAQRYGYAALVALVTIVNEHEPVGASSASYDVDVTVLWKGDPLPDTQVSVQDSSCGERRFDVGDQVLIVAEDISSSYDLSTGWCDPSIEEVTALAGDGLTAAGDPELFARINGVTEPTHPETPSAEHLLAAIGPSRLALMLFAAFCLAVPVGLAIGLRPITRKA